MGKHNQSFWVETRVIIFYLCDKLHIFLDRQSALLHFWLRLDFSLVVDTRIAKVARHLPDIL